MPCEIAILSHFTCEIQSIDISPNSYMYNVYIFSIFEGRENIDARGFVTNITFPSNYFPTLSHARQGRGNIVFFTIRTDQINMAMRFCYLVKSVLSRNTRPCITGHLEQKTIQQSKRY